MLVISSESKFSKKFNFKILIIITFKEFSSHFLKVALDFRLRRGWIVLISSQSTFVAIFLFKTLPRGWNRATLNSNVSSENLKRNAPWFKPYIKNDWISQQKLKARKYNENQDILVGGYSPTSCVSFLICMNYIELNWFYRSYLEWLLWYCGSGLNTEVVAGPYVEHCNVKSSCPSYS